MGRRVNLGGRVYGTKYKGAKPCLSLVLALVPSVAELVLEQGAYMASAQFDHEKLAVYRVRVRVRKYGNSVLTKGDSGQGV